jgi:hypothetical protein
MENKFANVRRSDEQDEEDSLQTDSVLRLVLKKKILFSVFTLLRG